MVSQSREVIADLVKYGALRPSEKNKAAGLAASLVDCDKNIEQLQRAYPLNKIERQRRWSAPDFWKFGSPKSDS
jgi:hypothetical protein